MYFDCSTGRTRSWIPRGYRHSSSPFCSLFTEVSGSKGKVPSFYKDLSLLLLHLDRSISSRRRRAGSRRRTKRRAASRVSVRRPPRPSRVRYYSDVAQDETEGNERPVLHDSQTFKRWTRCRPSVCRWAPPFPCSSCSSFSTRCSCSSPSARPVRLSFFYFIYLLPF